MDTSMTHNTKETKMDLKGALIRLEDRNQCTFKKSYECEIRVFLLNTIVFSSTNVLKHFNF